MKKVILGAAVVLALTLTSCGAMMAGALFTDVTTAYAAVPTEQTLGTREGRAQATSILGLIATGDAGINAAARAGGITRITHIDRRNRSILGIISWHETIVHGN